MIVEFRGNTEYAVVENRQELWSVVNCSVSVALS